MQTWRDVHLLWTAIRLGLTADQARQIAAALQPLQQRVEADRAGRGALWTQSGASIQAVVDAWIAGQQADDATLTAADAAGDQANGLDTARETATDEAVAAAYQVLTEAQQGLVETPEAAADRQQAEELYEGAPDLASYIANQLIVERELMPDEYALVRDDMAEGIVHKAQLRNDDQAWQLHDAVLQLLDNVSNMTDGDFDAQRADLPSRVADFLQLPPPATEAPIHADEFRAWVADPRTGPYMALFGTQSQPLPAAAPDVPGPLDVALRKAEVLTVFQSLRLGKPQLTQFLSLAANANAEAHQAASKDEAYMAQQGATLIQALPYLAAGTPLTEAWSTYLRGLADGLVAQDRDLDRAVAVIIEQLSRVLDPVQAARLDLTPPAALCGGQTPVERARVRSERAARMREAIRLTEGLRHLDQMVFEQIRFIHIEEFLGRYMDPGDPAFARARMAIADQITASRGLQADDWDRLAPEIAAGILTTAGADEAEQGRDRDRPDMTWRQLRDLLVADETLDVLQRIAGPGQ
jgi:hypothetical protein